MRDLKYWFEVSKEIGLWDEPKQLEEFLTELQSCEYDFEAFDIVGSLLAEAILQETRRDPFDPVVQYCIERPDGRYHIYFVIADKRTGLCLTLQPANGSAMLAVDASQISSVKDLSDQLEKILTHIRSVYRAYSRK